MDAGDLSQDQRDKIRRGLCHHRDDLGRLLARMREKGWYTDDAFLNALQAAHSSLHAAVQMIAITDSRPPRPTDKTPFVMPPIASTGPAPPNAYAARNRRPRNWPTRQNAE